MRMKVLEAAGDEEEETEDEDSGSEAEEREASAQITKKPKVQHTGDEDDDMINTRAYQEGYNRAMATRSFAQMQQNPGGRGFRGRGQWRGRGGARGGRGGANAQRGGGRGNQGFNGECYNCGKVGHRAFECRS